MKDLKSLMCDLDPQTYTRLEVAKFCLGDAYVPIPVRERSKVPLIESWENSRPTDVQIEKYFTGEGNIAVLTGEPSGWLVDVNLQCDEAVALADSILPTTKAITGHERRPMSHWWYICRDVPPCSAYDPVTGELIAEVRSTGQMSLVGPSTHPTGGQYDVFEEIPQTVSSSELLLSLIRLGQAVCALRGRRFTDLVDSPGDTPRSSQEDKGLPDLERYPLDERVVRAERFLQTMPPVINGEGDDNVAFRAATAVIWDFAVPQEDGFELMRTRYNPRCQPPLLDDDLYGLAADVLSTRHSKPRGWMLETADA